MANPEDAVTISQAREQSSLARQEMQQEQRRIEEYEQQANAIELPRRSLSFQQKYLKNSTLQSNIENVIKTRKQVKQQMLGQAAQAKQQLKDYETNTLAPYESQINAAEQDQYDYQLAQKFADKGIPPFYQSKQVRKYYQQIMQGQSDYKKYMAQQKEFKDLGLTPKYKNGQLTGFEDYKLGMSYPIENFPSIVQYKRTSDIPQFEKAGLIQTYNPADYMTLLPQNNSEKLLNSGLSSSTERLPNDSSRTRDLFLRPGIRSEYNNNTSTSVPYISTVKEKSLNLFEATKKYAKGFLGAAAERGTESAIMFSAPLIGGVPSKEKQRTAPNDLFFNTTYQERRTSEVIAGSFMTPLGGTTKLAVALNAPKIQSLLEPANSSNQSKAATLRDLGIEFGASAAGSALVGGGVTALGLGAKTVASKVTNPLISKGLGYAGKGLEFGVSTYFQTKFIGEGIDTVNIARSKDYEATKLSLARLSGGVVGAYGGVVGTKKGFTVARDLIRTRGLTEVPATEIVAPEYFKGQRYPQIRSGQTAGQLMKEFYNPVNALKETSGKPRMFTASPRSFSKNTKAGAGSSELYGLYGAPRLSAIFLKTEGERIGLVGTKVFSDISEPTALRTELGDIGLAPGVSPRQRNIRKLDKKLKVFFGKTGLKDAKGKPVINPKAIKGKAYVPFIKTEKEAVLTVGSDVNFLDKKYFFKIGKRRVPIFRAGTNEVIKGKELSDRVSLEESRSARRAYESSSRRSNSRYSIINPLVASYSILSSRKGSASKGSYDSGKSNRGSSSSSLTYKFGSFSLYANTYPYYSSKSKPKKYPPIYYKGNSYGRYTEPGSSIIKPPRIRIRLGERGRKKRGKYRQPLKYTPSFAALALNIKAKKKPIEVGGKLSFLPGFRPIISR